MRAHASQHGTHSNWVWPHGMVAGVHVWRSKHDRSVCVQHAAERKVSPSQNSLSSQRATCVSERHVNSTHIHSMEESLQLDVSTAVSADARMVVACARCSMCHATPAQHLQHADQLQDGIEEGKQRGNDACALRLHRACKVSPWMCIKVSAIHGTACVTYVHIVRFCK